ncbi:RagB/SusD family nutrient uptake outer membrane protein [Sediminibacterium soli]|uniref:RagB/SusD family nutrient uptake outer membrane protein n=1 Tax=Sediminibacterium soli TaxID=2698829 RepID=UPI00137A5CF6|nr:RagB/SusD family nutrient uptake outer membrane protein [Sediminibacterium soli]NCI47373.1 RagB/SusD family nutrient uptake outer membrane protein [Sediminibacterium soli]
MNTRHIFKLAALSATGCMLLLTGCKKFLDQQPITDVSAEVAFADVPGAYKALAGAYSRMVGDAGFGIRLSLYYTVDTDEMQGPTGNSDNDRRDIARYAATSGNAQITNPFNQLFQGIEFSNICIANIPRMALYTNGTDQEKKKLQRMYGEALTLRAQYYFEAIKHWGDLPAHFAPASQLASSNPFPSRTDRDTLYNRLIADLKLAEDLVPWRNDLAAIGDQPDERITKGTVKALRARLALFRGGYALRQDGSLKRAADYLSFYQIARDACEDIIKSNQHNLNPSFKALWKDQVNAHAVTDPQGELMFQASAIGGVAAEDTKLGYYNGPSVNGFGNKSINVLPTYFYLFDSTDLRRDVTCAIYNVASDGATKVGQAITAICDGKYRRDWVTNPAYAPTNAIQYFGLKWQIIRYSDVLLMFAEAENELNGPTAAAYNAVNMVRRRGYGKPIGTADVTADLPAGLTKATFFAAITKERSLELGGEGVRKSDLIRWNLLAKTIADTKTALTAMSTLAAPYNNLPVSMYFRNNSTSDDNTWGASTLWANSFYKAAPASTPAGTTKVTWLSAAINTTTVARYATGFVTGKSELMPIPQPARDANVNLAQNPGY